MAKLKNEPQVNGEEAATPSADETAMIPSTSTGENTTSETGEDSKSMNASKKRGMKRTASSAFSDENDVAVEDGEEFRGFGTDSELDDSTANVSRVLERMEADVSSAAENFTPTRHVAALPNAASGGRFNKRLRQETEGSRPSSSLSMRSDGEAIGSSTDVSSPAAGAGAGAGAGGARGRRQTVELTSPLLRAPLERGWRRELVYRAALDAHSRRNADIYYYSPQGKKLRSTREVSEHLGGTGLTLENFSFFKEPLGVDDPEKEIIRDAKLIRRLESPVTSPAPQPVVEGKRTPKPKPPKGASPEPVNVKPLQTKLKVKSVGSRISAGGATTTPTVTKPTRKSTQMAAVAATPTTPQADNNNTTAWKKPRVLVPPPPPLQSRPPPPTPQPLPKNCRSSSSPPVEPPPLVHKSGHRSGSSTPQPAPAPARPTPPEKRVLLRMKVARGGAGGERVWAVAGGAGAGAGGRPRAAQPQGLAVVNGRRFIVVPRCVTQPAQAHHSLCESGRRGRPERSNGAASPPAPASPSTPRRRGRPRAEEDHFTPFYTASQKNNYNVVVQIFQYLGMRDLANCARVCRLWRQLAATPALWRHVRMKNSQVSDWCGLCAALERYGTKRLDLRKMLLPPNDGLFWEQFAQHISSVDTIERIEMCRCPARAVEAVWAGLPGLRAVSALAVRDARLDPAPLAGLTRLHELRLKSMAGLALASDLTPLAGLTALTHLSLTSIKDLGSLSCDVVGGLHQLVSLELGECTFGAEFGAVLARLQRLQRLRLERGTHTCAAPDLLRALATLPHLTQLELVNFDVKTGFDDALAECKNIQRLLIIPTYVSQSATTNKQVLNGVLQLKDTLTHLMWGVTIELLRVTELFIDQCEQGADKKKADIGECIPVLKPVPGCKPTDRRPHVAGPPQVEILPLPTLQRLLSAQLPNTKLKLLRIPFHATWRQSLADFQ